MNDFPQWGDNDLFIAPSTSGYNLPGISDQGLFTRKNIAQGSILCIKRGISIGTMFWRLPDYDTLNIWQIKTSYLLDRAPDNITYADYVQDPLDMSKVNADFQEIFNDGYIVLKINKDISAGKELFAARGSGYWMMFLRSNWNHPLLENINQAYSLNLDYIENTLVAEYNTSKIISDKLNELDCWQLGEVNSVNNMKNIHNSCFMAAVLQCLSHIPSLSRILLETNLVYCNTLNEKTSFLYHYIQLLKLLINKEKQDPNNIQIKQKPFVDDRNLISSQFVKKRNQDAEEFHTALLTKFSSESTNFKYIEHHLFNFYCDTVTTVNGCNHSYSTRSAHKILQVAVPNLVSTLDSIIFDTMKEEEIDFACAECRGEEAVKAEYKKAKKSVFFS